MNETGPSVCIVCAPDSRLAQATTFAHAHGLSLYRQHNDSYALQLVYTEKQLELLDTQLNTSIHVDFAGGTLAHRHRFGGGRGQAIARAVGLKRGSTPTVLDITAGLARDAFVLASLGCRMTLVEQSAILCELISDGIQRCRALADCNTLLGDAFELHNTNAIDYMRSLSDSDRPQVIYIDPMYPQRKKSALVKKDMQILQRLIGKASNVEQLLQLALATANGRVVLKRPRQSPHIGEHKPHTSVHSKNTRYDIYMPTGK